MMNITELQVCHIPIQEGKKNEQKKVWIYGHLCYHTLTFSKHESLTLHLGFCLFEFL